MGNREIAIGEDVYETISESGTFYVDMTRLIGKWFRKKHKRAGNNYWNTVDHQKDEN